MKSASSAASSSGQQLVQKLLPDVEAEQTTEVSMEVDDGKGTRRSHGTEHQTQNCRKNLSDRSSNEQFWCGNHHSRRN